MKEMQERIDDYLTFGVRYVWLLHPRTRRAFVYTPETVQGDKERHNRTINRPFFWPYMERYKVRANP